MCNGLQENGTPVSVIGSTAGRSLSRREREPGPIDAPVTDEPTDDPESAQCRRDELYRVSVPVRGREPLIQVVGLLEFGDRVVQGEGVEELLVYLPDSREERPKLRRG